MLNKLITFNNYQKKINIFCKKKTLTHRILYKLIITRNFFINWIQKWFRQCIVFYLKKLKLFVNYGLLCELNKNIVDIKSKKYL